jgi:hypothetical protein
MKTRFLVLLMLVPGAAFASSPTITAITPASLGTAGGTITVSGTDFAPDAIVKVGGYGCANLAVSGTTQFTCTAAENIARKADVVIENGDGGTATATAGVTYTGTPGFALLQARLFTRQGLNPQGATVVYHCSGCHGGAKPDGNLDTTVYAQVALRVVAGNPAGSKIYQETSGGKMPPPQRQPALAPEELQALSDWITAGGQNN